MSWSVADGSPVAFTPVVALNGGSYEVIHSVSALVNISDLVRPTPEISSIIYRNSDNQGGIIGEQFKSIDAEAGENILNNLD